MRLAWILIVLSACSNDNAVTGPVGASGAAGAPGANGADGAPGAFPTTAPSAPTHVYLAAGTRGAPSYALHWSAPSDGSSIDAYNIYDTSGGVKTLAQTVATASAEVVAADNVAHAFVVTTVSAAGVEGAPSSSVVINTAPHLFYASGSAICSADINGTTVPACVPDAFGLTDPINTFAPSPDGSMLAIATAAIPNQLYLAASDGSSTVPLQPSIAAGAKGVIGSAWSPDGSRLAYLADQDTANIFELYLATPAGVVTKINTPPPPTTTGVVSFEWSPDSQHLAYVSPVADFDDNGLFISALDGTPGVQITVPSPARLLAFPLAAAGPMAWAPDSQALFFATEDGELFSTSLDGATVTTLTSSISTGLRAPFALSPDGNTLVAIKFNSANDEAWVGPAHGGTFNRVSSQVTTGNFPPVLWSPDGSVFALVDATNLTIMSASGEQTIVAKIATNFAWSPNGSTLTGESHPDTANDLYDCDHAGANCVNISQLGGTAAVSDFSWSPGNDALVWHDGAGEQLTWVSNGATQTLSTGARAVWRSPGFISPTVVDNF